MKKLFKSRIGAGILSLIAAPLLFVLIFALTAVATSLPSAILSGYRNIEVCREYQLQNMEYLRNEYYKDYTPVDENAFAAFDIDKAVAEGVRMNEVAVIGTHNSYQPYATYEQSALSRAIAFVTLNKKILIKENFSMDTFTQQLNLGIRNLEVDMVPVTTDEGLHYTVTHRPVFDNGTTAYDFSLALEEVRLWSENNPGHLPITLLVEPKDNVINLAGAEDLKAEHLTDLDVIIREVLGEKLLTPDEILGSYESFEEMRLNDGWPYLGDVLGKILVLLHPCSSSQNYINIDTDIRTQAMLPMVTAQQLHETYAGYVIHNEPELIYNGERIPYKQMNFMLRTRADVYPNFSDERYALALDCEANIITTDFPPRVTDKGMHVITFDGYLAKLIK